MSCGEDLAKFCIAKDKYNQIDNFIIISCAGGCQNDNLYGNL